MKQNQSKKVAKQSQQAWLPQLHIPTSLQTVLQTNTSTTKLIAHCENTPKQNLLNVPITQDVHIIIGPEGDFSPTEIE